MLVYDVNCNKVYEMKRNINNDELNQCLHLAHKFADISNKQFIEWLLSEKKPFITRKKKIQEII